MILSKIDTYNISIIEHSPVQVNNRLKRRQEDVNESSNWSIFYYSVTESFTGKYFVRRRSVLQPRSCCNPPKGKYHLMVSLSKLKDGYNMWKCANTPSTRPFVWGLNILDTLEPLVDHWLHTSFLWLHHLQSWNVYLANSGKCSTIKYGISRRT